MQGLSRNGEISDITYTSSGGRQYITPNYDSYWEWCCYYHAVFYVWNDVTNVWDTVSNPASSYPFFENWNAHDANENAGKLEVYTTDAGNSYSPEYSRLFKIYVYNEYNGGYNAEWQFNVTYRDECIDNVLSN